METGCDCPSGPAPLGLPMLSTGLTKGSALAAAAEGEPPRPKQELGVGRDDRSARLCWTGRASCEKELGVPRGAGSHGECGSGSGDRVLKDQGVQEGGSLIAGIKC